MSKIKLTALLSSIALGAMLTAACSQDEAKPADSSNAAGTSEDAVETAKNVAEIKTMKGEDLVEQNSAKKKDEVLIIDVRSPEEYKAGHIPNAININVDEFESRISEVEDYKDKPIITYCNSGNKSGKVAEILVNNGFQDVTNAEGVKEFDYELVHYEDLRGEAFQKLIDENQEIVLVDVRPEKQAKEEGMIESAINIPFDSIEENLDKLPKEKTIALYCNTGTKSAEVAKRLEELGYKNVVNSIEGVKEHSFSLVQS